MIKKDIDNSQHEMILYQVDDSNVCVSVIFKDETFWLSQKAMAELFDCTADNISLHLKNIYKEEELEEVATTEFFSVVQKEGSRDVSRRTKCYSLDAIIYERADAKKPTMGLTTWRDAPDGKIYKKDIAVAKNYLNEKELSRLNRLVTMFIDYAELMAEDEILMSMKDWVKQTDTFLKNNRRKVLEGKGCISHEQAVEKANKEYEVFRVRQDESYISEFDKQIEKYLKGEDI